MMNGYLWRIAALLSLLVLARLANHAQEAGIATASSRPALGLPSRGASNKLMPTPAPPLARLPTYLLVSAGVGTERGVKPAAN